MAVGFCANAFLSQPVSSLGEGGWGSPCWELASRQHSLYECHTDISSYCSEWQKPKLSSYVGINKITLTGIKTIFQVSIPSANLKTQKVGVTSPMFTKHLPLLLCCKPCGQGFLLPKPFKRVPLPLYGWQWGPCLCFRGQSSSGSKMQQMWKEYFLLGSSLPQSLFWGLTLLPGYTLLESFCIAEPQWWQSPWPLQTIFLSTGLRWESRETNLKIDAGRQPTHQAIGYFQTWLVLSSEHKLDQMRISATFLTVKEHHVFCFFPKRQLCTREDWYTTSVAIVFHGINFLFKEVEQGLKWEKEGDVGWDKDGLYFRSSNAGCLPGVTSCDRSTSLARTP